MGQVAHEPDRVGEGVDAPVGGLGPAHGRVKGGEQGVLDHEAGAGEPVHQGGLAGVGVPGDRDRGDGAAPARAALDLARGGHGPDLAAQPGHPTADAAPVELDLGLAGAAGPDALAADDAPSGLAGHGFPPAAQARQQVLQLGELDLGLALARLGVLGEDVEDDGGAVHDLDAHDVLQGAALGGGELAVDNDRVGSGVDDRLGELPGLAGPEVGGGVGVLAPLDEGVQDLGAGSLGEGGELGERGLGVLGRPGRRGRGRGGARQVQADEHDPLQADPAVLDLADVLELGAQAGDAAGAGSRLALQEAVVVGLAAGVLAGGGGQGRPGAGQDAVDDVLGRGRPARAGGVRGLRDVCCIRAARVGRVIGRGSGAVGRGVSRVVGQKRVLFVCVQRSGAGARRTRPACRTRVRVGCGGAASRHRLSAYGSSTRPHRSVP